LCSVEVVLLLCFLVHSAATMPSVFLQTCKHFLACISYVLLYHSGSALRFWNRWVWFVLYRVRPMCRLHGVLVLRSQFRSLCPWTSSPPVLPYCYLKQLRCTIFLLKYRLVLLCNIHSPCLTLFSVSSLYTCIAGYVCLQHV
jgi:hypothetical protein